MAWKKWFNEGDIAHMSKNKRARGFMLKEEQPVKILETFKIEDKAGGYMYTIEVEHPKTKKPIVLKEWVTQLDLIDKELWDKLQKQERLIKELELKIKEEM